MMTISIEPQTPFERLPALAERLGVAPVAAGHTKATVLLHVKDGCSYDLFDLMNAFLDKLDDRRGAA
jgi:hypothetical protein